MKIIQNDGLKGSMPRRSPSRLIWARMEMNSDHQSVQSTGMYRKKTWPVMRPRWSLTWETEVRSPRPMPMEENER
jgi:hypothetical protein